MHPALPPSRKTIDKRRGPHCRSWDCHDKVASYVGKEAGPSRIGSDMRDPICSICFPCYRSIKKPVKQIMFTCFHLPKIFMFPCYNISRRREGICIEANCCRFSVCARVCTQKQHKKQHKTIQPHPHPHPHTHTPTHSDTHTPTQ